MAKISAWCEISDTKLAHRRIQYLKLKRRVQSEMQGVRPDLPRPNFYVLEYISTLGQFTKAFRIRGLEKAS